MLTALTYRGVLFDDARHFHGKDTLKSLLDVMAKLGYNVLQWHISDDQGFRLRLEGFEELAEHSSKRKDTNVGGYLRNHPGGPGCEGLYSPEDVGEIISYAAGKGIAVMPELDMPGHFSAILSAYPQYGCGGEVLEVPGRFGVLENTLCLGNDEAREFAKALVLAVAKQTGAKMLHIGFDEIKTNKMCACPACRARAERLGLSSVKELIPLFRREMSELLRENGIEAFAWNDASSVFSEDTSVTMIHWRPETNRETARYIDRGQKMILSDFYHAYADYPYCMTPLKKTLRYRSTLPGVVKSENILGMQLCIWSEFIADDRKIPYLAYYRLAALAENWREGGKRPYREFIDDLRSREEELFGTRLDIPESILNPVFPVRLWRFIISMLKDTEYEFRKWLEKHEREAQQHG